MAQATKEGDGVLRGSALGEGFEARVPSKELELWGMCAVEDLVGVRETGGTTEGANEGDASESESGEGSTILAMGFDEKGVCLFEFKWGVEVSDEAGAAVEGL